MARLAGFVLEATAPWELPETLLGALRLNHLDVKAAKKVRLRQVCNGRQDGAPQLRWSGGALSRAAGTVCKRFAY